MYIYIAGFKPVMRLSSCPCVSVQPSTCPLKVRFASLVLFTLGSVTLDQRGVAAELSGRDCVEYQTANSGMLCYDLDLPACFYLNVFVGSWLTKRLQLACVICMSSLGRGVGDTEGELQPCPLYYSGIVFSLHTYAHLKY